MKPGALRSTRGERSFVLASVFDCLSMRERLVIANFSAPSVRVPAPACWLCVDGLAPSRRPRPDAPTAAPAPLAHSRSRALDDVSCALKPPKAYLSLVGRVRNSVNSEKARATVSPHSTAAAAASRGAPLQNATSRVYIAGASLDMIAARLFSSSCRPHTIRVVCPHEREQTLLLPCCCCSCCCVPCPNCLLSGCVCVCVPQVRPYRVSRVCHHACHLYIRERLQRPNVKVPTFEILPVGEGGGRSPLRQPLWGFGTPRRSRYGRVWSGRRRAGCGSPACSRSSARSKAPNEDARSRLGGRHRGRAGSHSGRARRSQGQGGAPRWAAAPPAAPTARLDPPSLDP